MPFEPPSRLPSAPPNKWSNPLNLKSFLIRAGAVRLSRGVHNSLHFLATPQKPIKEGESSYEHIIDPEVVLLGLAEEVEGRPGTYSLTALGRALADFAPHLITGKKAQTPRLSVNSIWNSLPHETLEWLVSGTPLPDNYAAPFFERLGVIHYLTYGGIAGWCFTTLGVEVIREWETSKLGARSRVRSLFTDNQRALLAMASVNPADPTLKSVDRRTLRSLGPDGYNFLMQTQSGLHIRPEFEKLVEALTSSRPIRAVELFEMFPHEDKLWFMSGFTVGFGAAPGEMVWSPRADLMRQMGWITMNGKRSIKLTPEGEKVKEAAYQLSVAPISDASYAADLGHEIGEAFADDPHGIAHLDFSDHNVRVVPDSPEHPTDDASHNLLDDFDLIGHTDGSTANPAPADQFDFI